MPFKVGSPYLLIGEVIQDRNEGILARTNKFPSIISCKINVNDIESNKNIFAGVKIVPEKDIVQSVVPALLIQSVDSTINRIGLGTGKIELSLRNAVSNEVLDYENIFYNENDIAVEISKDLNSLFETIYYNFYEKIDLNEILIDVSIKKDNKKAIIKEVKTDSVDYFPGDNIEARIIINPFRQPEEERTINIKIPDDFTNGNVLLIIKGGSSKEKLSDTIAGDTDYTLLKGWVEIEDFLKKKEKNYQIIANLVLLNEKLNTTNENEPSNINDEMKVVLDTDFVIEGYHEIFLNVKEKNDNQAE